MVVTRVSFMPKDVNCGTFSDNHRSVSYKLLHNYAYETKMNNFGYGSHLSVDLRFLILTIVL